MRPGRARIERQRPIVARLDELGADSANSRRFLTRLPLTGFKPAKA
jgi:hypothetical protein